MPYIGNEPSADFTSLSKQDLTGSSGAFVTLSHAVANAEDVALYINNVRQEPTTSYTTNGTRLNFVGYTVSASDDIYVLFLGKAIQTTVPPDGSVSTAKIASSAVDLTSKVTGVLPVANGGTGISSGLSLLNFVNGLTVSGTNVSNVETNLTGTALNGGAKTIRISLSGLNNRANGYMFFSIKSADGYTDNGYSSAFKFDSNATRSMNGSSDSNLNSHMAFGYYGGLYNVIFDCHLIDPTNNHWVFEGRIFSYDTATGVSGMSVAHNILGANKPITGFKISSGGNGNSGAEYDISNLKYGYIYAT